MSDASSSGYALHETRLLPGEGRRPTRFRDRWRFKELRAEGNEGGPWAAVGTVAAPNSPAPVFEEWVDNGLEELDGAADSERLTSLRKRGRRGRKIAAP